MLFRSEAWPQISHAFASAVDAATEVQWIAGITGLEAGASVLDAPCGFGRHSIELGRVGYQVTGVDFSETELERAGKAWWPGSSRIQGLRGTKRRFDVH